MNDTKWISINERVPEGYRDVIVHVKDGAVFMAKFNSALIEPWRWKFYFEDVGLSHPHPEMRGAHTVTHWMPLPSPPKE